MFEVTAHYPEVSVHCPLDPTFEKDAMAVVTVGRDSNYSGTDFTTRDIGWLCKTEDEAQRIATALRGIGLAVDVSRSGSVPI